MKIDHYLPDGQESENLHKTFVIPKKTPIYRVRILDKIPFNFYYTSLEDKFEEDLEKIKNGNNEKPNAFLNAKESFSSSLEYLLGAFSSPKQLPCFSGKYSINIFLARNFEEFCSIGSKQKRNLPEFATGRVSGTNLVYLQNYFIKNSREQKKIPEKRILGDAHELLHIFFNYNSYENYGRRTNLPFLFNEGLTVICGKQISKEFKKFVSPKQLFLEQTHAFDYDKRWITENSFYQSAGQFMDYLLRTISKKEEISYKDSFQKMFEKIGCPESLDKNKEFNSAKFMKEVFNLDIEKEYQKFVELN